jgi:hypothetical protein
MSTSMRLTTVAPDLVELGKRLPASKRKALARLVAEWACRETGALELLGEDLVRLSLDEKGGFKSEAQQGANEWKLRLSKRLRAYVRRPRMVNEMHG